MRSALSVTLAACLLLAGMTSTVLAQAGPPPAPQAGATGQDLTQPLEARIAYWVDMISKATNRTAISDGRLGLTLDFRAESSAEYVSAFASILEKAVNPLLDGLKADDPMLAAKQINLALALTMAHDISIEPSLKKMVVSPNVAVRYMGWGGYKQIRSALLTSDGPALELVATVGVASRKEESPMVVGAMFDAMNLSQGGAGSMSNKVRQAVLGVLSQNWNMCCRQVLGVDPAWAEACMPAMPILADLDAGLGSDKATRKKVRQMMVDMAWCAAHVYQAADAKLEAVEAERAKANAPEVVVPAGEGEGPAVPPAQPNDGGAANPTPTSLSRSILAAALAQARPKATPPAAKTPPVKTPPVAKPPVGAPAKPGLGEESTIIPPAGKRPDGKAPPVAASRPAVPPRPVVKKSIEEESLAELVLANASLLRSAEIAMAAGTDASRNPIRRALQSTDDKQRGAKVVAAISEWVETFKDDGVRLPLESDFAAPPAK